MRRALIHGTRVAQVVDTGQDFPVGRNLQWVDCPDNVEGDWTYDGTNFIEPAIARPLTDDERIDKIATDRPEFRGLIRALAARFATTEAAILSEIKSQS